MLCQHQRPTPTLGARPHPCGAPAFLNQPSPGAASAASSDSAWAAREGLPYPLGVSWLARENAYNFAIYSKHAQRVSLLLFDPADLVHPCRVVPFDPSCHKTGRIWHTRISAADAGSARYYAFSIDGPAPEGHLAWHAFDPDKVLLDPYSRCVSFPPGFDRAAAARTGSNAGRAPLGVLAPDAAAFDWGGDRRPRHDSRALVYELHVRGFTRGEESGVGASSRGTYQGVVEKIPYLRALGVTIVELMPVFQRDPGQADFWGYMPLCFFAPEIGYARRPEAARSEFRAMVRALHEAGIEVVLDVVFNHTTEGDHRGPTYSYRGIDNSTYYLMRDDPSQPYVDFSGTGNSLNCANRYVRKMIVDSMRYWVREMHVDGFRFDLASIFTRGPDGSIQYDDPPIFGDIAADPDFESVRLIAEPWDASGAYQLGRAFPGTSWLQWNDRFRDDLRRFARGDAGMVAPLMRRLYGSDDLFPDDLEYAYRPFQSLNYVTSHDGFTLYDLVAYGAKRNWANGHGNLDGPQENFSWNCGFEGDEGVPADVVRLRVRQAKNLAGLLLLANGTPMLRSGDEFLNSQGGNNNPYNQDNPTGWLDWSRLDPHREVLRFFQRMIAFRHAHPSIARSRFWRGDVQWYGERGAVDVSAESRSLAYCLRGASEHDDDLYVLINANPDARTFAVQEGDARDWRRVVDTARESPDDFAEGEGESLVGSEVVVGGRSLVVLRRRCVGP
jgi:isoamylase